MPWLRSRRAHMSEQVRDRVIIDAPTSSQIPEKYDHVFKIVMFGLSAAGKSVLLQRFLKGTYYELQESTIGAAYESKTIHLDGKTIKLNIFDVSGQLRQQTISESYLMGAHGCMVGYDITCAESFESVKAWLDSIDRCAPKNCAKMLIGNKSDLASKRAVEPESAQAFAESLCMPFLEISSKDYINVEEAFMTMVGEILHPRGARRPPPIGAGLTTKAELKQALSKAGPVDTVVIERRPAAAEEAPKDQAASGNVSVPPRRQFM